MVKDGRMVSLDGHGAIIRLRVFSVSGSLISCDSHHCFHTMVVDGWSIGELVDVGF